MSDFTPWWEGLSLSLKIYWGIAIPFTLFFVLQLRWSLFGGEMFQMIHLMQKLVPTAVSHFSFSPFKISLPSLPSLDGPESLVSIRVSANLFRRS